MFGSREVFDYRGDKCSLYYILSVKDGGEEGERYIAELLLSSF